MVNKNLNKNIAYLNQTNNYVHKMSHKAFWRLENASSMHFTEIIFLFLKIILIVVENEEKR